jgi:hypothetical protein
MSYISPKHFDQICSLISGACPESSKELCQQIADVLGYDVEAHGKSTAKPQSENTTYSEAHRKYYAKNRAILNAKRVENAKLKRAATAS